MLVNGNPATAMLTLTTVPPSSGNTAGAAPRHAPSWFGGGNRDGRLLTAAVGIISLVFLGVFAGRRPPGLVRGLTLVCAFCLLASCGTGGSGGGGGGTGGGSGRVATSISLTTSAIKTPDTAPPTIQVKVSSSRPVTGTVTFFDLGMQVNSTNVDSNGNAIAPGFSLYPGTHAITAMYSGDGNNLSSQTSGALEQVFTGTIYSGINVSTGDLTHGVTLPITIQ
jgi:hypothetical protein